MSVPECLLKIFPFRRFRVNFLLLQKQPSALFSSLFCSLSSTMATVSCSLARVPLAFLQLSVSCIPPLLTILSFKPRSPIFL